MEDRMAQFKWDPEMTTAIAAGFQVVLSQALPAFGTNTKLFLLLLFRKTATADCDNNRGKQQSIVDVKSCGTYSNQSALKPFTFNCSAFPHT
jgi:hypothetical protein